MLIKGLETKEELKIAHVHLKEQQETIDELRRNISEKTAQMINIQNDLEKSSTELQEKVCLFFFLSFVPSFLFFLGGGVVLFWFLVFWFRFVFVFFFLKEK